MAHNTEPDPLACLPTLHQHLHDRFSGPHTQYASNCFYTIPGDGTMVHAVVVMSCTQLFLCDSNSYVLRVALVDRLLAVYQRTISPDEKEVLLVFDGEHDMLLRGAMTCDGTPPKPFVSTIRTMYHAHYPDLTLTQHLDCREPLRDMAKLKIPSNYVSPLPAKEEDFVRCPCWRHGDVVNMSSEEFANRVRNIFIVHCPEKLSSVPEICRKYNKKRGGALQYLVSKYGPEPSEEQARAVRAMQEREERFSELVKDDSVASGTGGVQLLHLLGAQKEKHCTDEQPLTFAQLLLSNRPSGGYGRVQLRITPVPYLAPQQPYTMFKRRGSPPGEFWYLCNEGYVLSFETDEEVLFDKFGYNHGDRVLSTWGVTRGQWSTVIGVRDGALWVHDDGQLGATMLAGFQSKDELERCNGWMLGGRTSLKQVERMRFLTDEASYVWLNVTPEVVFEEFGVYHGEKLVYIESGDIEAQNQANLADASKPFVVVVGVDEESGSLFVQSSEKHSKSSIDALLGAAGSAGSSSSSTHQQLKHPITRLTRCAGPGDLSRRYGLRSSGASHEVVGLPATAL